ncbi:hypothetical protein ASD37_17650 [Mycobacterium sp. Root135]|uniref:hypothetical protein n=1 Tax=Mycobacterium sp. Root135 TaxID=1736457 RepID=UPI0006F56090|nr:hypothetical protein [Mycobacterium sp. Root135]KQY06143.1 hypothetical protein ASD37_17650 [Mycobacterium sp. Root135]
MTVPPFQPPPPPPGWYPPPPPPPNNTGTVVGLAVVGVLLFGAINLVVGLVVIVLASDYRGAVVGVGAVILALIAFGGGAGLIALRRPWAKGLGIGLMIGWALLSITSVGFCTGLNPEMYTGGI